MVGDEAVSDNRFKSFGPKEWKSLYSQADSLLEEAAVTLAPFGGLTANAVAHLRSDWVRWGDEFVKIRVPKQADCNQWKMVRRDTMVDRRDKPCSYCRNTGATDGFENLWPNRSEPQHRVSTLHRGIAEPAVDVLERVFNVLARSGMYATPASVGDASKRLLPDCESEYVYPKLLRTGVSLYCHYGLETEDIVDLSPYVKDTVVEIIRATPEVTNYQHSSYSYLRTLADREPASVQELASELGVTTQTARQTLNRLKDSNRVKVDRTEMTYKWSIIGDWTAPFVCDICGYQSPTLQGIDSHKRTHDE